MALSRAQLVERVLPQEHEGGARTLDVHVSRVRKKLGAAAEQLVTVWGVGYKLVEHGLQKKTRRFRVGRMGLRAKLTLWLVAIVLPVVVIFSVVRFTVESRDLKVRQAERFVRRLRRPAQACRPVLPRRFARRGGMRRAAAYDPQTWAPRQAGAPQAPEEIRRAWDQMMGSGETITHLEASSLTDLGDQVPAPCRALWLQWGQGRRSVWSVILPQVLLLLTVLIATGLIVSFPLIRRIRKLRAHAEALGSGQAGQEAPWSASADELGQLARAFERTASQLRAQDAALKEYVANTTHDLAIPLTVLQHRLGRLGRAVAPGSREADLVRGALEESHYIGALIANMSAAAKLERQAPQTSWAGVELGELIARVIARHEPIAQARQVELGWATPPEQVWVRGDSVLIEQAASNLVQNALQYNEPGGHVAVVLEQGQGRFELRVEDDGPGGAAAASGAARPAGGARRWGPKPQPWGPGLRAVDRAQGLFYS